MVTPWEPRVILESWVWLDVGRGGVFRDELVVQHDFQVILKGTPPCSGVLIHQILIQLAKAVWN